jgi:hypothetical protein
MTKAPIFGEIERKKKVAGIIRNVLKPFGLDRKLQVHARPARQRG